MENKPFIKTEVKVKPEPDSKAWLSLPKFEPSGSEPPLKRPKSEAPTKPIIKHERASDPAPSRANSVKPSTTPTARSSPVTSQRPNYMPQPRYAMQTHRRFKRKRPNGPNNAYLGRCFGCLQSGHKIESCPDPNIVLEPGKEYHITGPGVLRALGKLGWRVTRRDTLELTVGGWSFAPSQKITVMADFRGICPVTENSDAVQTQTPVAKTDVENKGKIEMAPTS